MTVSLITGSSRGIGRSTAEKLAALGHHVIVTSRDADAAAEAARAIVEAGGRARGLQLDVTDAESVRRAAADVTTLEGRLDVLVNNAGVLPEATGSASEAVGLDLFVKRSARTCSVRWRCSRRSCRWCARAVPAASSTFRRGWVR